MTGAGVCDITHNSENLKHFHVNLGGYEFDGGCRRVYGRVWREQRQGTNIIKLYSKNGLNCLGT